MSNLNEQQKTGPELRREREQRVTDVIALKPVDRVPVSCEIGFFAAKYGGVPYSAAYYDFDAYLSAYRKTLKDFQPDMAFVRPPSSGKALEYLDPKYMKWPGHGLGPNVGFQAIEIESMMEDEYDLFMDSPADFLIRHRMARLHGGLAGLSLLPELSNTGWMDPWATEGLALTILTPQFEAVIENLRNAGRELQKLRPALEEFERILIEYGMPQLYQRGALPPYDIISHSARGMRGTMLDMYRRPEKLLALCDFLLEKTLARPLPQPNEYGNLRVFVTITRGSDDFISMEQFKTFYWPGFKKLIMNMIERGATPCVFIEGTFDSRLEYLLEFPKGKMCIRFDKTDIFRAKEILKDHTCIEGNVPASLLQVGTVEQVKDYCKKLIDVVGKGGGYILGPRSSTDEVKPENLKAMIEFTKEYGRY